MKKASNNRNAKFTIGDILTIKALYKTGTKRAALAKMFKVKHCTITAIVNGMTYKNVS